MKLNKLKTFSFSLLIISAIFVTSIYFNPEKLQAQTSTFTSYLINIATKPFVIFNSATTETNPAFYIGTNGNVGIGNSAPTTKLDVTGEVKASNINVTGEIKAGSVDSGKGAYAKVFLNTCGGNNPCPSYHTIGVWTNVAAIYNHFNNTNNTAVFGLNGTGNITIKKAGTYRISVYIMQVPTDAASADLATIFINGSVYNTDIYSSESYRHSYGPAGWWSNRMHEYVIDLPANTTLGYGYQALQPLTYWAHDRYTGMVVQKVN